MSIDHFPSILKSYVEDGLGFVTAAEGFIFLSGYVAGFCYLRTLAQKGEWAVVGRAANRARSIYVFHICAFLIVFGAMARMHASLPWAAGAGWDQTAFDQPFKTLFLAATLRCQPMYFDILPMYLVFFLLVPAVIFCLRRKGWWLVLLASATVWLLTQLAVTDALKNQFLGGMFGWFNILGWQVLFIFGMVFGYYRSDCNLWSRFGKKSFFLAAALAAVLFVFRHKLLPHSDVFHSEFLIGKPRLGPVRVLNFAVLAVVFSRPQIWPSHALWTRMLSLLGRNSLPVFSFHIVLMYLVRCFVVPHVTATQTNMAFLAVATVVLLYLPASLAEVLNYLNVQGEVSTPSS